MIETEIARAGATTALGTYESWLVARTLEEPGILRRIAFAMLYEFARQERDTLARAESLNALVAEGDPEAVAVVTGPAPDISQTDERMLAALGNGEAIDRVSTQLKSTPGLKLREIRVLGDSRSPKAITALIPVLADPMPRIAPKPARLIAPYDPAIAIAIFDGLRTDPNVAIREETELALAQSPVSGFPALRQFLRATSGLQIACRGSAPRADEVDHDEVDREVDQNRPRVSGLEFGYQA